MQCGERLNASILVSFNFGGSCNGSERMSDLLVAANSKDGGGEEEGDKQ